MSKSALASLTAQYTDSENEEDHSADSENSQASQVIIPKSATPTQTPERALLKKKKKTKKKHSKKLRRLVSYQDDTIISDEADSASSESSSSESSNDSDSSSSEQELSKKSFETKKRTRNDTGSSMDTDVNAEKPRKDMTNSNKPDRTSITKTEKSSKYAHYKFSLPPEPKGKPSTDLVEKINNLYEKMETNNMDMNRIIQQRKEFRNPSIYDKLIQFCDINEFGTNYPPEIYDPLRWGNESYYEELAKVQKNEMVKRQKDKKDTDKIEQATALARKVEEEAKKRKSKWDQPAPKPVSAPLTTTVTGTKGTVISAFGSLPKKT